MPLDDEGTGLATALLCGKINKNSEKNHADGWTAHLPRFA